MMMLVLKRSSIGHVKICFSQIGTNSTAERFFDRAPTLLRSPSLSLHHHLYLGPQRKWCYIYKTLMLDQ